MTLDDKISKHVAIDFGTSHSGFALIVNTFLHVVSDMDTGADLAELEKLHFENYIKYKSLWPGSAEPYPKTRTALLYRSNGSLSSWGNQAENQYLGMKKAEQDQHIFIERFKLFLDESRKHVDPAMEKLKALGKDIDDVIADYLRALAGAVRQKYEELSRTGNWNPRDMHWCLTVPAMWSLKAMDTMQRAIHKAGLTDVAQNASNLRFCSEPLAGLLYELLTEQSSSRHRFSGENDVLIRRNDPVLIVDMGGGTVDLTAMRVCGDGFKEIVPGLGASCGSTMLDLAFLNMFRDVVGVTDFDRIVQKNPQPKAKLLNGWRKCKLSFQENNDGQMDSLAPIPVSNVLRRLCDSIEEGDPLPGTGGATLDDGELYVTRNTMQQLYRDIVEEIHGLILSMLGACSRKGVDITHIVCVGGFSQSTYLIKALRERLQGSGVPGSHVNERSAAVLLGAARLCLPPGAPDQPNCTRHVWRWHQYDLLT
ncbi:hypothetical protein AMAG_19990 [Allomyces macrogynus ATCC 38327]|uniref:Hsp70-like protein n=1 Tax=Allomyces macrogynus (strain ATCC 38327) TaxID=578462 RepID=A0A0L0T475_ALLM3|nr:hypothetical protein AMAG_19990 [Allomyces macrogynus ATCC 38327]|eukprot:KNE69532.1 hypothetical protein AMAG_19990 [Allomyces macrogynus ATCC 38327]